MKNIHIIGAGGIGSFFIKYFIEMNDIFLPNTLCFIKVYDNDIVEEKNLKYQNFVTDDLMVNKAEALSKRYPDLIFENTLLSENNINSLEKAEIVVLCVDNHKTRQLVYKYCLDNKKWLIDLRAQGTIWGITIVDGEKDMEYFNNTIFKNENTMQLKGSCQLKTDIDNDNIQNSNRVVAYYGAYCFVLQHLRSNKIQTKEFKTVY